MGTFVIFSSAWLARRLEIAEAMGTVRCGKEVIEVAGGYAVFGGPVSPMTQAIGVGMGTPVTAADIDRIEQFYRERDANANIHLCPLADATLAEILGARAYRPTEFTNMLMRMAPPPGTEYPAVPEVAVRAIDPAEIDSWANIVLRGFMERDDFTEPEKELGKSASADPKTVRLIATVDGAPAGGAAFAVSDGVGLFMGDSTLKEYRGRGVHMALLRERLRMAGDMGAELIAASTLPGSISQRNYERLGFQVMYTKVAMVKEFAE